MVFILLLVRKVSRIAVVFSGLESKKRERKSGLTTDLTSDVDLCFGQILR